MTEQDKQGRNAPSLIPKTCNTNKLASWQIKLAMRLGTFDAPGVYPLVLIVDETGRRKLRLPAQDVEELGQ